MGGWRRGHEAQAGSRMGMYPSKSARKLASSLAHGQLPIRAYMHPRRHMQRARMPRMYQVHYIPISCNAI
jgi:hypothetical protein